MKMKNKPLLEKDRKELEKAFKRLDSICKRIEDRANERGEKMFVYFTPGRMNMCRDITEADEGYEPICKTLATDLEVVESFDFTCWMDCGDF